MQISREQFVGQFWPCVKVHALGLWPKRSKSPPDYVAGIMYDRMQVSAGEFSITRAEFSRIVEPVIHELHRITPKGSKPDADELCGRAYDALNAAGAEVAIRPPTEAHGHRIGQGPQ